MSSVVSLGALNPFVLPAFVLHWLLALSMRLSKWPMVRTALYLMAVLWSQSVIWSIRAITPACACYALYYLSQFLLPSRLSSSLPLPLHGLAAFFVFLYTVAEVVFYFQTLRRGQRLQARVVGPELTIQRRWLTFRRVEESSIHVKEMFMPSNCVHFQKFKHKRQTTNQQSPHSHQHQHQQQEHQNQIVGVDSLASPTHLRERHPLDFLSGWFFNLPFRHIKHDNLMVFFAENAMGLHLHELSPQQLEDLEQVVAWIQVKASRNTGGLRSNRRLTRSLLAAEEGHSQFKGATNQQLNALAFKEGRVPISVEEVDSRSSSPSSPSSFASSVSSSPDPNSNSTSDESEFSSSEDESSSHNASPCVSRRSSRADKSHYKSKYLTQQQREVDTVLTPATPTTPNLFSDPLSLFDLDWSTHVERGTLPSGREPDHDPMHLNLAPVTYIHRPLLIYGGVHLLNGVAGIAMSYLGFSRFTSENGKLTYWYRPAKLSKEELTSAKPRPDPLVLIHGIGIGPATYLHLLSSLIQTDDGGMSCHERSVYVIELPYISMKLGHDDVPSPLQHVEAFAQMLYRHELDERMQYDASYSSFQEGSVPLPTMEQLQLSCRPLKAMIVGHSYGTFVATWITKHRSDLVASLALIDPVCFMVFDPSLIYNFLYRTPFSLVTSIYHFFTSKELGIAHTLYRHFWWYENVLWNEEIERVGMSANQLEASLVAEREMGVESLPIEDLLHRSEESPGNNLTQTAVHIDEETEDQLRELERSKSDETNSHAKSNRINLSDAINLSPSSSTHPGLLPSISPGLRVHVFVSDNDDITPVRSVSSYLSHAIEAQEQRWGKGQAMMKLHLFEGVGHAECLFHSHLRSTIVHAIQRQPSHRTLRLQTKRREAAAFPTSCDY